jgi:hypothetical protein
MSSKKSDPPGLAIWLLRHACPGNENDALIGDLIERFREGQTYRWLWRQVLIAFAVGVLAEMRRHWPHFCYAIAGTAMTWFFWDANVLKLVPGWLHWRNLPWPWSQLAFELSRPVLLALAALPALAVGLVIDRSFRWGSLLRTGAINLALIMLGHYLPEICPWLFPPVVGNPDHFQRLRLIIPPGEGIAYMLVPDSHLAISQTLPILLWAVMSPFSLTPYPSLANFLISAWLGCLSPRHATSIGRRAEDHLA